MVGVPPQRLDTVAVNGDRRRDAVLLAVRVTVADDVADDLLEYQLAPVARSGLERIAIEDGAKLTEALFETWRTAGERQDVRFPSRLEVR